EIKRDWFNDRLPDGAVARLGTAVFCHGDMIRDCVYSSDGRQILSISNSLACVWDAKTGQLLAEFPRPGHLGGRVDGALVGWKSVCLVLFDGVARAYDVESRKETRSFDLMDGEQPRRGQLAHVAFTPDGRTLGSVEADGTVGLWNAETGVRGRLLK